MPVSLITSRSKKAMTRAKPRTIRVDHPLVEVVDVELVDQDAVDEREALLHRRGTLAGAGPVVHRPGQAAEHEYGRDDRHRHVEVEGCRRFANRAIDHRDEAVAEAERLADGLEHYEAGGHRQDGQQDERHAS